MDAKHKQRKMFCGKLQRKYRFLINIIIQQTTKMFVSWHINICGLCNAKEIPEVVMIFYLLGGGIKGLLLFQRYSSESERKSTMIWLVGWLGFIA